MSASRLRKLRAMPMGELVHRLRYAVHTSFERRAHARGDFAQPGRLRAALVPMLRRPEDWKELLVKQAAGRHFFALKGNSQELRELFGEMYRDELSRGRAIADRVLGHEITFFGETFHFGSDINWHADPVTGKEWPCRYHRDIPVSGGNIGYGDVKYVWELNRHQFLIDVAKIAFLDESDQHAAHVERLLDDWLDVAPYGSGVPWACALEPAFRAWSWLWAYHMLLAAGLLTSSAHLRWLEGFLDHASFLHRHLERYSSPFNHLVGEASTLFVLGLAFPEFEESDRWVRKGRRVIEATVSSQFHADGGTVEQSTFYHHATLGFYILAAIAGRCHGIELDTRVWTAIERGLEFSVALVQPDGRLPSIGGADDGKPINLEHLAFWDFRPYYAIGAVLFKRGDFKTAAGQFWEDALWILGPRGLEEFGAISCRQPAASRTLPESGYSVFRSDWSASADYLCFDCGEQAAGLRRDDVPSAAHGHADCLSVIASLAGRPVLVDPGFYCYNGPPDWEVHFRKTAAHNTLSIDGRDQARHLSKMAWTHTYTAHLEGFSSDEAIGWARGSHDGYADGGKGVIHRRTVWLRRDGYVVICDELTGRPGHVAHANFQFAPGAVGLEAADSVLFAGRFELSWRSTVPVKARVIEGGELPSDGWIASSLGVRERAPRLLLEFPVQSKRVVLLSILADRQRAGGERSRCITFPPLGSPHEEGLVVARIQGPDWDDAVVAAGNGRTINCGGIQTDASLVVVRLSRGVSVESRRIGGSFLHVREEDFNITYPDRRLTLVNAGD